MVAEDEIPALVGEMQEKNPQERCVEGRIPSRDPRAEGDAVSFPGWTRPAPPILDKERDFYVTMYDFLRKFQILPGE